MKSALAMYTLHVCESITMYIIVICIFLFFDVTVNSVDFDMIILKYETYARFIYVYELKYGSA